jgi:hypothetical protein
MHSPVFTHTDDECVPADSCRLDEREKRKSRPRCVLTHVDSYSIRQRVLASQQAIHHARCLQLTPDDSITSFRGPRLAVHPDVSSVVATLRHVSSDAGSVTAAPPT